MPRESLLFVKSACECLKWRISKCVRSLSLYLSEQGLENVPWNSETAEKHDTWFEVPYRGVRFLRGERAQILGKAVMATMVDNNGTATAAALGAASSDGATTSSTATSPPPSEPKSEQVKRVSLTYFSLMDIPPLFPLSHSQRAIICMLIDMLNWYVKNKLSAGSVVPR